MIFFDASGTIANSEICDVLFIDERIFLLSSCGVARIRISPDEVRYDATCKLEIVANPVV